MKQLLQWICGVCLVVLVSAGLAWGASLGQNGAAVRAKIVLNVYDRDLAADRILQKNEAIGGYFTSKAEEALTLRVPTPAVQALLEFAAQQGEVLDRAYSTENLRSELLQDESVLRSKEKIKSQYLEVLANAGYSSVLYVEQEIVKLVEEIETLKGKIRLTEHRMKFAEIEILFRFKDRKTPVADGRSSFSWLNTLNLVDLIKDF